MLDELRTDGPRAESYWAQQLAFGPVLVHALGLRLRTVSMLGEAALVRCVELALAGLGALPEAPEADAVGLRVLATRQARALGWRRRATLCRLLQRLGATAPQQVGSAPLRMTRCYPLIGFRPEDRLAG
jgi:hypothetical protein